MTGEVTEFTTFIKDGVEGDLGRIIVSGAFDLSAGVGKSRYRGHICLALIGFQGRGFTNSGSRVFCIPLPP
jgi:hypothetical protein